MCDVGSLLGEVIGRSEIPAKEPDLAVYVPLEQGSPVQSRELAVNCEGRSAGNGGHLPDPFTSWLEGLNRAVENNKVSYARGVAVTIAIDMLKSLFFELSDEVLVECYLEFSRHRDLVRLDCRDLNRRRPNFDRPVLLGEQRAAAEK